MVICLERGADDLHMIQLIGLTFLVPDYPYCRKQAMLNGCLSRRRLYFYRLSVNIQMISISACQSDSR